MITELRKLLVQLSRSTGDSLCRITDCEIAGWHFLENPNTDAKQVEEEAAEDEEMDGGIPGIELAVSEAAGGSCSKRGWQP